MKLTSKTFISCLFTFILIFSISTFAATPTLTPSEQQDIKTYVARLESIQNALYTASQTILFPSESGISSFTTTAPQIRTSLDRMLSDLTKALSSVSPNTPIYRNLLILQNATNYIRAELYELVLLSTQDTPSQKLSTLERYFNFRSNATDSINLFNTLQSAE